MRIYIIANDGIMLCRKAPATVNDGEIAVGSNEELHAAPLSAKRLLALWNALPGVEKRKKVGDRGALIDQLWSAIELLPDPEPQPDPKRPSKQDGVIAMLRQPEGATVDEVASVTGWQRHTVSRRLLGNPEEKARARSCLGQRRAWPGLPDRRAGEPVKPPVHDASARQYSGELSSVLGPNGGRKDRLRNPDLAELDSEIAGLVDRPTQGLRRAWRTLHHTGPPLGLSRDLIIRGLADKLQQRAHGGPSRALQRRLETLAGELEKGACSFDPGIMLKTGASLVRQWRGHTHTVLVREDGFEYEGQRYRSLTVIAAQITGAHWSGPRFFGVSKRARAS
jgi:Protein of unknown function (DUF2924)/Protein of unknown function (DUF3489)